MKITGELTSTGSEISIDSEECGKVASRAIYSDLNRTLAGLQANVQVDPALRPYLEEELALGVERALQRFQEDNP